MGHSWELSRRDFMVAALVVAACGGDDQSGKLNPDGGAGAGGAGGADAGTNPRVPFGVWEEVRAAVRTSPDHLAARADALVLGKDPVAIYEFVRDHIITLPANPSTLGGETGRLFGVRGTLRGGAGTMRDKADLLVDLFERAGLTAEVVAVSTPKVTDFVKTVLIRTVNRVFDPQVSDQKVAEWLSLLKVEPASVKNVLDSDNSVATALAQAVLGQLPSDETSAAPRHPGRRVAPSAPCPAWVGWPDCSAATGHSPICG
jgi:transglutaminase-like putative cysteine protease